MFFSKLSLLCFVAILGTSWFSEGGFTAVEAYPQQYSSQFGTGNQQATTQDGSIWQQYIGQYYHQQPTVVYRFPETPKPYPDSLNSQTISCTDSGLLKTRILFESTKSENEPINVDSIQKQGSGLIH
uniref:Uncharacterized protein n=1 Tax=Glyptapanteles indiensis TaxID=92994 RepID=A0JCY5_GLYIN|nr:hypothetical protein GIP_L1_00640 [Glyptapanteles indiensis]